VCGDGAAVRCAALLAATLWADDGSTAQRVASVLHGNPTSTVAPNSVALISINPRTVGTRTLAHSSPPSRGRTSNVAYVGDVCRSLEQANKRGRGACALSQHLHTKHTDKAGWLHC